MSPIQMELSEEGKTFGQFFVQFMESTSNFKHLERKNDLRSQFISEITDLERLGLTVNMLMGPKSAWKTHKRSFILSFLHSERSWFLVRPVCKKHRFRTPFECQHAKGTEALVKSSSKGFSWGFKVSKYLNRPLRSQYQALKAIFTHWFLHFNHGRN